MTRRQPTFEVRQEDDAVATTRVVRIAFASVAIGVVGVAFAGWLVFRDAGALRVEARGGEAPARAEIARVEQTPIRDARRGIDLREAQERELARWGWADRGAAVAIIPIEQAIDVVAGESR